MASVSLLGCAKPRHMLLAQAKSQQLSIRISRRVGFLNVNEIVPGKLKADLGRPRCAQAERVYWEDKTELDDKVRGEGLSLPQSDESGAEAEEDDFGEVNQILSSRVVNRKTEYLIEWKDDYPRSWEPAGNIAKDLIAEFETQWWKSVRKLDMTKLKEFLADESRDVNAIDESGRTALHFVAGLGSVECVNLLVEEGADVHWQDKEGFTALHIAAGYVNASVVKALLDHGADPEAEDAKGRSPIKLTQDLLKALPKNNPLQFARKISLDQVSKLLDDALDDENVEIEQIVDKRVSEGGIVEYLVKWSDGSADDWVAETDVGLDLVNDYEAGLEYGIAENILDERIIDGKLEYLVQWADKAEASWEPEDYLCEDVIADFKSLRGEQAIV